MGNMTSKKFAFTLMFLLVFGFSSTAAAKTFMVGLKGGANSATFVGEDVENENKKRLLGFSGGAMAAFNFGTFGFQPELLYSVKGVRYESDNSDSSSQLRYNYLQIPLLLRLNASLPAVPVTAKFMIGPSFSQFLSGTSEGQFDFGPFGSASDQSEIDPEDVRSPYIDGIVGLGVEVGAGPGVFVLDVRYEQGLTTIDPPDPDYADEPSSTFHSSVTGHLGYAIGF